MESILLSVKKLLGIPENDSHYDIDLILFINSAFSTLNQLGVGPADGFMIEDDEAIWNDFLDDQSATEKQFESGTATQLLQCVKQYIVQKVRLGFDPPSTSFHLEAINKQLSELEWRMSVTVDPLRKSGEGRGSRSGERIFSVYSERRGRFS